MPFPRVDDHFRRHLPCTQGLVKHSPHHQRAAAVLARVQDKRRRLHGAHIGERAVPNRLAVGRPVGVNDEQPAVRGPLGIAIPAVVAGEALDAGRGEPAEGRVEFGDPDLGRPVAGVALSLVGADALDVGVALCIRARVPAVVGDEGETAAVRRERKTPVEAVVEDPAIRLVGAGQGDGRAAVGGDQPDVGGGVGLRRGRRRLLPALGSRPGGQEGEPLAVGREGRGTAVRLAGFQGTGPRPVPLDQPQRGARLPGPRIDPGASEGGAAAYRRPEALGRTRTPTANLSSVW
jgi:hypothetical protein